MPSLLISILLLKVLIQVLDLIPGSLINAALWSLYARLPIGSSATSVAGLQKRETTLKREVLSARSEMNSLSPQDDFARWAKARRKHDKSLEALKTVSEQLSTQQTGFNWTFSIVRWVLTKGLWWGILTWGGFRGWVVFYMPWEWALPWPVLWLLAWPRAPYGAVSVQVWGMAISAAWDAATEVWEFMQQLRRGAPDGRTSKAEPMEERRPDEAIRAKKIS